MVETRCFKSSQSLQERITPKNTHYKIDFCKINPFGGFTSLLTLIFNYGVLVIIITILFTLLDYFPS